MLRSVPMMSHLLAVPEAARGSQAVGQLPTEALVAAKVHRVAQHCEQSAVGCA